MLAIPAYLLFAMDLALHKSHLQIPYTSKRGTMIDTILDRDSLEATLSNGFIRLSLGEHSKNIW
jgi:hypothetical protein